MSPSTLRSLAVLVVVVATVAPPVAGQIQSARVRVPPPKEAVAVHLPQGGIAIDGALTELAWQTAIPFSAGRWLDVKAYQHVAELNGAPSASSTALAQPSGS